MNVSINWTDTIPVTLIKNPILSEYSSALSLNQPVAIPLGTCVGYDETASLGGNSSATTDGGG